MSAAKDLGITRVVVVGFFVSKAHATSLSLCIFLLFLSFDYFLSPYLSIILLFMSTYLGLPTTTYLPISTYLLTFDIILTYLNLPTPINVPTYNDDQLLKLLPFDDGSDGKELQHLSSARLHQLLKKVDPVMADSIHPNNRRKIVR